MKCVVDTSTLSWLGRIGALDLLTLIYENIYAPESVFEQLKDHYPTRNFVEINLEKISLTQKGERRFDRLVRRWGKKIELKDPTDIEVFILYKFFSDADEMVYANKEAERKLSGYGIVRDIADLPIIGERLGVISRDKTLSYLNHLLELGYRTEYIKELVNSLFL